MIEHALVELAGTASRVVHLSSADDARWSGVVGLAAGEAFEQAAGARTDLLLLRGAVTDGAGARLQLGDFASGRAARILRGGPAGATLLVYREAPCPGAVAGPTMILVRNGHLPATRARA